MNRARFARTVAAVAGVLLSVMPRLAAAQMGGGGGGQRQQAPTQSSPTQNRNVGPRAGMAHDDDDDDSEPAQPGPRGEPVIAPPANPLAIPDEIKDTIGSDAANVPAPPYGERHRSFFPVYEERRGDYRFRALPPLWLEQSRALPGAAPGQPAKRDTQSLTLGFFYDRRSPDFDADILFPLFWHVREGDSHLTVLGPIAHREAPGEHDNWLAPLFFEGKRKEGGGYFHSPLLLTYSHWSKESELHLTLNYFRTRKGTDVDWGFAPFVFGGDNGNLDGGRKKYTLVPFAFYYHREAEIDSSETTVAGPVILQKDEKRTVSDVLPFYFHIKGRPELGGVDEEHTTVFPFFHVGHKEDETLFASAVYLRRKTRSVDTMLSLVYSHATTRNGATSLTAVGPILPLYWRYRDVDINKSSSALVPFYYHSDSPRGHDWLTPFFGRFEEYGVSRTYWALPTLLFSTDAHGWEGDFLPVAFFGRSDLKTHAVIAPLLWDFANPKGRTTIVIPLYVRLADSTDDSIIQVTGNTVYIQKRVAGGLDWQFHVVPLVSYGAMPHGHWWNFLYGLTGYTHDADGSKTMRLFWLPITLKGPDVPPKAVAKGTDALANHF